MASALPMIGSLILFLMVPRGGFEPEILVGNNGIASSNQNYVVTTIHDDTQNGSSVNIYRQTQGTRDSLGKGFAPTCPVTSFNPMNEWPPWPNFGDDLATECSVNEAKNAIGGWSEGHNFMFHPI